MIIKKYGFMLLSVIMLLTSLTGFSFGFFAHRTINRMAVFSLPPEMIGLYKHHIEFISERSVDPDKRAHAMEGEAPRHYIDIDHFGDDPFAVMPRRWNEAVEEFTEDTLAQYGLLPWHITTMMYRLTRAFSDNDPDNILLLSSHIGHYIADACTPLHTTKYYNGRTPEERGIHALWESRLPELFSNDYSYFAGRATYIESPIDLTWELIEASHLKVDSIYLVFDSLRRHFPDDLIYAHEMRGQAFSRVYSQTFSDAFHLGLNNMVERQMRLAAKSTGDFWFTAWVNAGQPDLRALQKKDISKKLRHLINQQNKKWEKVVNPKSRYITE
jgi:hypothetical protein